MLTGSKKRILGGRSMSFSPVDPWLFVVGTETGGVMRAFRPPPGASVVKPTGSYTWKPNAVAVLDQLAANARLQLQHHVEGYCRTVGLKEVSAEVIFQSKPDPAILFPAPKTTDLEPHAGPVTVAAFSPYHRKLLLTGSADGAALRALVSSVSHQRSARAMSNQGMGSQGMGSEGMGQTLGHER
eukprot:s3727_g5.t1